MSRFIMESFFLAIKQLFKRKAHVEITSLDLKANFAAKLKHLSREKKIGLVAIVLILIIISLIAIYSSSKFLPETYVEDQRIGGLTLDEATKKVFLTAPIPPEHKIELIGEVLEETTQLASSSTQLEAKYDHRKYLQELLAKQKSSPFKWITELLFGLSKPKRYFLPVEYSPLRTEEMVYAFSQTINSEAVLPKAFISSPGASWSLTIDPGKDGFSLDFEKTKESLFKALATNGFSTKISEKAMIAAPAAINQINQQLTEEEIVISRARAEKFLNYSISYRQNDLSITLTDQDLISMLALPEGIFEDGVSKIIENWQAKLEREPQEPEFLYNSKTLAVKTFVPPKNGIKLELEETKNSWREIIQKIDHDPNTTFEQQPLSISEKLPQRSLEETNDLGIKELIGFGESYYAHSIPSRIHNVALTAQKINYTIIPPRKEFSFNQTLGDVSQETGFRPAYVIKDGATVLGDGGGVCQVSTTVFRSVLDAGLKVTRRIPHSYRVSYYELDNDPGFDATVYAGEVDLRFINDTDHHILLYTETDSSNLYMTVRLYGTSDGRTTEITGYEKWGYSPPSPTEYITDPSLPPGTKKQIDWSASGIKAKFTHIIRDKNGKITSEKDYYSSYSPWSAKYLVGP